MIEYHLAEASTSEVLFTITDAGGEIIQQFSSGSNERGSPSTSAGMNRFFWGMRYPGTQMPPSPGALDAGAVLRVREVRAQVDGHRAELPEDARVEADGIMEQLREIEGILTIWMGSQAHPMMWSPPGLTEKLSSLSRAVGAADAKPTESMYAVFEDLSERFEVQPNRLNQVIEQEIGPLLSR